MDLDDVLNNCAELWWTAQGGNGDNEIQQEAWGLIQRGRVFAVFRTGAGAEDIGFAPSRFIGYPDNSVRYHVNGRVNRDGRITNAAITAIVGHPPAANPRFEALLENCLPPAIALNRNRKSFWNLSGFTATARRGEEADRPLREGRRVSVTSTRFKRSVDARARAIAEHGTACLACEMDFGTTYGIDAAVGYIHVHHTEPLSAVREERDIDIQTLVPLCPNCHSVAHISIPPYTVDEIRGMLNRA